MTDEELDALDAKLASQIGDDISVIFNHEHLFKQSRAAIADLRAQLASATYGRDVAEACNRGLVRLNDATQTRYIRADAPELLAMVHAVKAMRDAMRDNIIKNDEPHTVVLPDGSRHSGPVVDFLHALIDAQISVLDAALAAWEAIAPKPSTDALAELKG